MSGNDVAWEHLAAKAAAYDDGKWWCALYRPGMNGACSGPDPAHEGEGCHLAVQPIVREDDDARVD